MKAPQLALPPSKTDDQPDKRSEKEAAQQEVFLREVDDALREEEMVTMLRRYGKPVLAILAVGLLAFAGYLWWDSNSKQQAGEQGEQFTVALDAVEAGNLASADKQLEGLAKDGVGGNAVAAKLMRAGIALQQNRPKDAAAIYAEIAADGDAPKPYRDLATVREVSVNFDSMQPQQVVDRLKPLAAPGNAWFGPAGELVGLAYLKQEKPDLAGPLFAQIARDKETPESLRRRARQMAGLLGVDAIDDAEKIARGEDDSGDAAGPAQ